MLNFSKKKKKEHETCNQDAARKDTQVEWTTNTTDIERSSDDGFFNQLFAGHDPISTPADLMASLGNQSMYTYKVAGPLVWIENELIRRLGEKVGYTQGGGIHCATLDTVRDSIYESYI